MAIAKSNYRTKIQLGSAETPATFVTIPGVFVVPPIESEQEKIEVTHHESGPYREYVLSGLSDPGDYEFQMRANRTDTVQQTLRNMWKTGEERPFRIIYPDGFAQQFPAQVSGFTYNEADATSPDALNVTVALAICGEVEDVSEEIESL